MQQIKQLLQAECELQEKLIIQYEKELKKLPKGSLSKKQRGNKHYYYYQYKTQEGKFAQRLIKPNEVKLTQQIKRKKYLKKVITIMYKNIKLLNNFCIVYQDYWPDSISPLLPNTYKDIPLSCYLDTNSKNAKKWLRQDYEHNNNFIENKIHQTISGEFVRSKSEAIIAGVLASENIPFKYEAALQLGAVKVSPDFTILRERDSKEVYWEHFGLIDDPTYLEKAIKKILLYREHGINLGDRLIITFDAVDGGIDVKEIQDLIKIKLL